MDYIKKFDNEAQQMNWKIKKFKKLSLYSFLFTIVLSFSLCGCFKMDDVNKCLLNYFIMKIKYKVRFLKLNMKLFRLCGAHWIPVTAHSDLCWHLCLASIFKLFPNFIVTKYFIVIIVFTTKWQSKILSMLIVQNV